MNGKHVDDGFVPSSPFTWPARARSVALARRHRAVRAQVCDGEMFRGRQRLDFLDRKLAK